MNGKRIFRHVYYRGGVVTGDLDTTSVYQSAQAVLSDAIDSGKEIPDLDMASEITAPVPLSTPDNHIFLDTEVSQAQSTTPSSLTDDEFRIQYEIDRTLQEIRTNQWRRIALQFPDEMLSDSARVYQMLARGHQRSTSSTITPKSDENSGMTTSIREALSELVIHDGTEELPPLKLTILADTSYGSCCVDEVAAEHVNADAVVHYGRSCLSPTSRLPVLYVYTRRQLDSKTAVETFTKAFSDKSEKVVLMADVPYSHHVEEICTELREKQGYEHVHAAEIQRDASSLIPNRMLPSEVRDNHDREAAQDALKDWSIFHISNPPTALLLTLESRVKAVYVMSTESTSQEAIQSSTAQMLRRRYALITSLNTVSTWGILINTLSVKNYLHIVDHVKQQIADADKKSYLFVVGKLNPAKVANFAEIGGWVVIGCWESSLIDSREFYRPIITPYELELVLMSDDERVWTGEWRSDFQEVLDKAKQAPPPTSRLGSMPGAFISDDEGEDSEHDFEDEESAPPEFDLRTGKYISRTRPMRSSQPRAERVNDTSSGSKALTKRVNGDMVAVQGVASPAAEFLAQQRTWRGLGSDFEIKYEEEEEGGLIEEGRTGVARGYTMGDSQKT